MKPFGLISDSHNHNFSAFASVNEQGINTRLIATLDEFDRCAATVAELGGDTIYHAGDLFHVRGSIAPSVLNPTRDKFDEIKKKYGVGFVIDAGNHDLEHKHSSRLGNAVEAVRCDHVQVASETALFPAHSVLVVPWFEKIDDLKAELTRLAEKGDVSGIDVILHAPIDGVIPGLPDHGLSADFLAGLGFKRVFAGHYHNHKDFGNGVYSIGALTHQTWSDVGSRAGFLVVSDDEVKWHCTRAPQFVEITGLEDPVEAELKADGNFVRVKLRDADMKKVGEVREWLEKCGAKGVRIDVVKEPTRSRKVGSSIQAGASIEVSIADFIKQKEFAYADKVQAAALQILAEAA